jgi:hypothetical protein
LAPVDAMALNGIEARARDETAARCAGHLHAENPRNESRPRAGPGPNWKT